LDGKKDDEAKQESSAPKAQVNEAVSSDNKPKPIWEADLKAWRQIHNEWLHVAMRAAMGDPTLTTIPDIENVERIYHNPPPPSLALQLA